MDIIMESCKRIFGQIDAITHGLWILLWRVGKYMVAMNFTVESEKISRLYEHTDAITNALWLLDLTVESWKILP